jgi:hypothetical protein
VVEEALMSAFEEEVKITQDAYRSWIKQYEDRCGGPAHTLGKCKAAVGEMATAFPELTVVRGHVRCPEPWGKRAHWWLTCPAGEIVDPTASQFTDGILDYEPFKEGDQVRLGPCLDCGESIWGQPDEYSSHMFCNDTCKKRYAAYLNNPQRDEPDEDPRYAWDDYDGHEDYNYHE